MSVLNTPYPHASFITFAKVLGIISSSIAFILVVFQPFGTESFTHPYKTLILMGYGVVIFGAGLFSFVSINGILSEDIKDKWTVGYEVMMLFIIIVICQSSCFFYWSWIFSSKLSLDFYWGFLGVASTVALLPIAFYLFYIYQQYKDVHHAGHLGVTIEDNTTNDARSTLLSQDSVRMSIEGTGKREKYDVEVDDLYAVKAEDNYVIFYSLKNNIIKKWMLRVTMSEVERQLTSDFIRIHRSFIINKNYIENLSGNVTNTKVKIQKIDDEFPVSRSKVEHIRKLYE